MEKLKKVSAETADHLLKLAMEESEPEKKLDHIIPAMQLLNAIVEES